MQTVTERQAKSAKTKHSFVPGIGYIAQAEPPKFLPHPEGGKNCAPPAGTNDGSRHTLRSPGGKVAGIEKTFLWVAAEQAWEPSIMGGNRLAWTADHLSKAGWEYVGPAGAGS